MFLIPRFYNKRLRKSMILASGILLIAMSGLELLIDHHLGRELASKSYLGAAKLDWFSYIVDGLVYIVPINVLYFLLAFAYRLPLDRQRIYEREAMLVKQKLEAELKFFKAQVHPHTLFNAMNSIYHLVDLEPSKAKKMVLNLSQSMRYHLYESQENYVPLLKELGYLENYIALNRIRIEEDVTITSDIANYEGGAQIAPLLFTPFVENAFKYVSQSAEKESNSIDILLLVDDSEASFRCKNTVQPVELRAKSQGGLGLNNVRSRLNLLYGERYHLEIKSDQDYFEVFLKVPLKYVNE